MAKQKHKNNYYRNGDKRTSGYTLRNVTGRNNKREYRRWWKNGGRMEGSRYTSKKLNRRNNKREWRVWRQMLQDVNSIRKTPARKIHVDNVFTTLPSSTLRPLRPIVIDGSNVAIAHGITSHCFSAKGILLAIEYFLKRCHTCVHAFVPKFRSEPNAKHDFPTRNIEILLELAEKQFVVFTPSRTLTNGKRIASYDDRFTVEFASMTGGVIVSNDNYRDLERESRSFQEVIEKRLLMFCFVGDVFMIPSDPLGRYGPSLEEFFSFPLNGDRKN